MTHWLLISFEERLPIKEDVNILNQLHSGYGIVCGRWIGKEFKSKKQATLESFSLRSLELIAGSYLQVITDAELTQIVVQRVKELNSKEST